MTLIESWETYPGGWQEYFTTATIAQSTTGATDGTYAVRFTASGEEYAGIYIEGLELGIDATNITLDVNVDSLGAGGYVSLYIFSSILGLDIYGDTTSSGVIDLSVGSTIANSWEVDITVSNSSHYAGIRTTNYIDISAYSQLTLFCDAADGVTFVTLAIRDSNNDVYDDFDVGEVSINLASASLVDLSAAKIEIKGNFTDTLVCYKLVADGVVLEDFSGTPHTGMLAWENYVTGSALVNSVSYVEPPTVAYDIYIDVGQADGTMDVQVDNLQALNTSSGTIVPQIMNNYRRLRS